MHLIVFSHLRWSFVYQRPLHLLSRLAREVPVLFIEEPLRAPGEPRLERSFVAPNVEVLTPHTPLSAPGFHDDQLALLKPLVVELLRERGVTEPIAWFYTPMALPLLDGLQPRLVVYDCLGELSAFEHAPARWSELETALLARADLVLSGGPALYEAQCRLHRNVRYLPSGVDADHFSPQRLSCSSDEAREATHLQAHIAHPRLGYFGVIDKRLDLELVAALADARPFTQIVMVGPVANIDPASLPRRANIHWLDQQRYALLPYLLAPWDVCLMPYALNEATRFISPIETLEYMAAEKPIVSTAVHEVRLLYGDVVRIAGDAAQFIAACDEFLGESEHKRVQRLCEMRATVARWTWDDSARRANELLALELQKPLLTASAAAAPAQRTHPLAGATPPILAAIAGTGLAAAS